MNNSEQIRLGLIGVGKWGFNYLKTIQNIDGATITLIACRDINKNRDLSNKYELTTDWNKILNSPQIDGVIIATPPEMHYQIAKEAIEKNKPIIIEKPMTLNSEDSKKLLFKALKKKTIVKVNHIYLYHPIYKVLKEYIKNNTDLISIYSLSGNFGPFREDVSPLWDWGPHDIAMCIDFIDEKPLKIEAEFTKITSINKKNNIRIKLFFHEDKFAELNFGNLMSSKKRIFEVNLKSKSYIFNPIKYDHIKQRINNDITEISDKKNFIDFYLNKSPLEILLKSFIYDIKNNKFDIKDLELGVKVIDIIEKVDFQLGKY